MTRIKCCGMFRPCDIDALNVALPDYCGFVVDYPKSHRSVSVEVACKLRGKLDARIAAVGVFVDMRVEQVARAVSTCQLQGVQLHGSEDESYIAALRELTDAPIIKAFTIRSRDDLMAAKASTADYVLLDNGKGTGEPFDWRLLKGFGRPYFLAGGLTPDTIPHAIRRLNPYALDLSSGLETDGAKDPEKIAVAVRAVRELSTGKEQM